MKYLLLFILLFSFSSCACSIKKENIKGIKFYKEKGWSWYYHLKGKNNYAVVQFIRGDIWVEIKDYDNKVINEEKFLKGCGVIIDSISETWCQYRNKRNECNALKWIIERLK